MDRQERSARYDDQLWEMMFKELVSYHKKEGTWQVPLNYMVEGYNLHNWRSRQSHMFNNRIKKEQKIPLANDRITLIDERLNKMLSVNYDFSFPDKKINAWNKMYDALSELYQKKGFLDYREDPKEDVKKFDNWIATQKTYFRKGKLSEEQVEKLRSIKILKSVHVTLPTITTQPLSPRRLAGLDPLPPVCKKRDQERSEQSCVVTAAEALMLLPHTGSGADRMNPTGIKETNQVTAVESPLTNFHFQEKTDCSSATDIHIESAVEAFTPDSSEQPDIAEDVEEEHSNVRTNKDSRSSRDVHGMNASYQTQENDFNYDVGEEFADVFKPVPPPPPRSTKAPSEDKLPLKRRASARFAKSIIGSRSKGVKRQVTASQIKSPQSAMMTKLKFLTDNGITIPTTSKTHSRTTFVHRIAYTNGANWQWDPTIVAQAKFKVCCLWEQPVQEWLFKLSPEKPTAIRRGFVVNIKDFLSMDPMREPVSLECFMERILEMQGADQGKGWNTVGRKSSGASSVHYFKIHKNSLKQRQKATARMVEDLVATAMTEHNCAINKSTVKTTLSIIKTSGGQEVQHAHVDFDSKHFGAIYDYCKQGDGESQPDIDTIHTDINMRLPWVMFSPLTDHGMYLALWPDNYKEVNALGKVVFIPPGMILFMRGDTLHAGGFDNTMGVEGCIADPTKRLHGYIFKCSAKKRRKSDKAECYLYPVPEEHDKNQYDSQGIGKLSRRDLLETW